MFPLDAAVLSTGETTELAKLTCLVYTCLVLQSYCWANQPAVLQVARALEEKG